MLYVDSSVIKCLTVKEDGVQAWCRRCDNGGWICSNQIFGLMRTPQSPMTVEVTMSGYPADPGIPGILVKDLNFGLGEKSWKKS